MFALPLSLLLLHASPPQPEKFCLVYSSDDHHLLLSCSPAVGTRITVVDPQGGEPFEATVAKEAECDAPAGNDQGACSELHRVVPSKDDVLLAVGIVGGAKVTKGKGSVVADFGDGAPITLRSCASSEGLHFTGWSGKPLKGKRVWHAYWHFDYETDADCKEPEYRQ